MPRPRNATNRPIKRRTTSGCQPCRKRKIKCNEVRPVCTQCQVKGLECTKTAALKWENEYLSKGLSFGRAGVWSKHPYRAASNQFCPGSPIGAEKWCDIPKIKAYSFLNLTVGSIAELTTLEQPDTASITSESDEMQSADCISTSSPSPWSTAGGVTMLGTPALSQRHLLPTAESQENSLLLSYYIEKICPMTMASWSSQSPLASLLVPFAVTTSTLAMDSILALAACHRSRSDPAYKTKALQRSQLALHTLQAKLRNSNLCAIAKNPETLAVMLLLCWFEIVNECDKRWVVHLKGARDLVRIRRQALAAQPNDYSELQLSHFCERFFAFQDVMGRTACGEDPVFGSDFWISESSECDPWLGCSPELISILARIAELGRQNPISRCTLQFQAEAASLEHRLATLKQEVGDRDATTLGQAAELKRLAAELYLQCVLNGAGPTTPWVTVQIPRILRLIGVLLEFNILAGITWPLFIAAVELDPHQDLPLYLDHEDEPIHARLFVLKTLDRLTGSVINASKARSVIETVWHTREMDCTPDQDLETRENDWNLFVAPFCGNMSLA
ncbi:hypothetical protein H2200_011811 [Cladophialophora chaetospira]|uniref:Zn(2)-C6 fungal-type domain-containing protein n=1 Tax=Cladophialophora chaetospira TaxID=386627 RepID=A0AA38WYT1_9EURO|nr:hypothetical protein H2200_011811 [Cladophialophora chaetospira]